MKICIYGAQGHVNSVFDYLEKADDACISAICCEPGEDASQLQTARAKVKRDIRVYHDYREMLCREKPDIAAISSYPHKNAEAVLHALNQNIHVFCEKPAAITMEKYARLETALHRSTAKLYTMMTERFVPEFHAAYMAAADGLAGTVRLIDTRKSYKLGIRPDYYRSRNTYAGTLSWVGIHAIDRIYCAANKRFQTVIARSNNSFNSGYGDLETTGICLCELECGIQAAFTCDYYRPAAAETHGDDRLRIVGTKGIIEVTDGAVQFIGEEVSGRLPVIRPPFIFGEFLQYIKTGRSDFLTTEDCMYTTYIALKTIESSDTGGVVNLK